LPMLSLQVRIDQEPCLIDLRSCHSEERCLHEESPRLDEPSLLPVARPG
jgi:hypothetical protein